MPVLSANGSLGTALHTKQPAFSFPNHLSWSWVQQGCDCARAHESLQTPAVLRCEFGWAVPTALRHSRGSPRQSHQGYELLWRSFFQKSIGATVMFLASHSSGSCTSSGGRAASLHTGHDALSCASSLRASDVAGFY